MKRHDIVSLIGKQTECLRKATEGAAAGIRRCLSEKGIDVAAVTVAEWFPDGPSFEFGIFVTDQGAVIQFGYDYSQRSDELGEFSESEDLSSCWRESPHCESIAVALEIARGENGGGGPPQCT